MLHVSTSSLSSLRSDGRAEIRHDQIVQERCCSIACQLLLWLRSSSRIQTTLDRTIVRIEFVRSRSNARREISRPMARMDVSRTAASVRHDLSRWNDTDRAHRTSRIHTSIWLDTDRANVSWPVTVAFVWPSVLEQMSSGSSRVPLTVDFGITPINVTKVSDSSRSVPMICCSFDAFVQTHTIIISNPATKTVDYVVQLVHDLSTQHSNETNTTDITQSFIMSPVNFRCRHANRIANSRAHHQILWQCVRSARLLVIASDPARQWSLSIPIAACRTDALQCILSADCCHET
jgi:hypothetical protein